MPLGIAMSHGDSIASLLCKILIWYDIVLDLIYYAGIRSGVWSRI